MMKNNHKLIAGVAALCLVLASALFVIPAGAGTTTTTAPTFYAWDKDGHTYVSTQSQADANAAAAAWNKKNTTSASWSGFVVYGTCTPSNPPNPKCPDATSAARQIIDIKGEAESGTFWLATSNSGAVFTSSVSQADADAKAAADLNPAPSPAYRATSSVGVTYTSAISQADANAMASFVEHTALPSYTTPGPNGMIFSSTVSYVDAIAAEQTYNEDNLYGAAAGDYIGFDVTALAPGATTLGTNPADMIFFSGPSQAAVDATAKAWGTALVRGGVYLATNVGGTWLYVNSSQAGVTALATEYPYAPNSNALVATSITGQKFYNDMYQQWADNAAAYAYQKPRPLPTSPEICYQGSKSNTVTLLSWQCPAHWTLLTPATTSKAALAAAARAAAKVRALSCDSQLGNITVRANAPQCPAGFKAVENTVVCVKGKVTRKVTELAAKCPAGFRTRK
jgi:hypothetical protein